MDVIKVDKMTKDYGSGRGIFNVSLRVEPGEVFGFLGPNGAGKSTTIRHLMGFSAPDSGSASIFGRESFGHYCEFLGRVGYIPGEVALPRGLTGCEFISMMQSMQGVRNDAKLKEMLDRFELDKNTLNNGQLTKEQYNEAVQAKQTELTQSIAGSLLSTLPSEVSDALEEIGTMDLYSLIVGSIFYKLAGLLLPIIYMIMASNNLIAGQVDSGSMAYVLSTSTKRRSVAFTQAVYLIGSLFAMFTLTTATGCICLTQVSADIKLTYEKLVLLNLGAFLVLFALSGLCFFTSCWFDRSKRSMAIGGGLSIFALVAAMLGLFGSPVLPTVVRLDSLNYFNYATIITMFDVISIIDGTNVFVWKLAVLFVLGLTGYIAGSEKFVRKDLPL